MSIAVDITIQDTVTGEYSRIPVLPESIPFSCGDAIYDAVKILSLGNVEFFNGVDLDSISWSRFFRPGTIRVTVNLQTSLRLWNTGGSSKSGRIKVLCYKLLYRLSI